MALHQSGSNSKFPFVAIVWRTKNGAGDAPGENFSRQIDPSALIFKRKANYKIN
jgi:hypothetical protein